MLLLRRCGRRRIAGRIVLVSEHDLEHRFQESGITSGWIAGGVARTGLVFAPIDPQPVRNPEIVVGFLGTKRMEILVVSDELLECAATHNLVGGELVFHRRPASFLFSHKYLLAGSL